MFRLKHISEHGVQLTECPLFLNVEKNGEFALKRVTSCKFLTQHRVEPLDNVVGATEMVVVMRCRDQNTLPTQFHKFTAEALEELARCSCRCLTFELGELFTAKHSLHVCLTSVTELIE